LRVLNDRFAGGDEVSTTAR